MAAVGIDALEPVAPLEGQQRPERARCFNGAADTSVWTKGGTKSGVAHRRRVEKPIEPDRLGQRECRGRAQYGAAIVANQRRRIAAQPIVERAERVAAEAIEIASR